MYEFEITLLSNRTDTDKKTGLLGLSKNIYPRTGYERPQEEQSYRPTLGWDLGPNEGLVINLVTYLERIN